MGEGPHNRWQSYSYVKMTPRCVTSWYDELELSNFKTTLNPSLVKIRYKYLSLICQKLLLVFKWRNSDCNNLYPLVFFGVCKKCDKTMHVMFNLYLWFSLILQRVNCLRKAYRQQLADAVAKLSVHFDVRFRSLITFWLNSVQNNSWYLHSVLNNSWYLHLLLYVSHNFLNFLYPSQ